jgi:hypothetical protein
MGPIGRATVPLLLAAVSDAVEEHVAGIEGVEATTRLAGADRYETSCVIHDEIVRLGGARIAPVFLVRGD